MNEEEKEKTPVLFLLVGLGAVVYMMYYAVKLLIL